MTIHFIPRLKDIAACGLRREVNEFWHATTIKPAVTCVDCQLSDEYAAAKLRINFAATPTRI